MTKSGIVPNKQLRRHRLLRGWSLDDLASAVVELGKQFGETNLALTAKTVGRWERGESNPRSPYPKLLCALFGRSAEELGLGRNRDDLSSAITTTGVLDARSDPRTILGALGSGLVDVLSGPGSDTALRPGANIAPRGIDPAAAALVSDALALFRRLDDRLGAQPLVRPTLALRNLLEDLNLFPVDVQTREKLRAVGAQVSQFLGWLAFDASDHSTARAYYQEGLFAARASKDQNLTLFILGHIAILALTEGKLIEAVTVVESQIEQVLQTECQLTRSWFSAVEATVRSISGDRTSCQAALDRSRKAFFKAGAAPSPPWLYSFDQSRLTAYEGGCLERIGELDRARTTWGRALELLPNDRVRDRAVYLIHLATVYARLGEVEQSCDLGEEAIVIALETSSVQIIEQLGNLRLQLNPWNETGPVRSLDRHLARVR